MSEELRVLQIEDSESDAALVVRLLEKAGYTVQAARIEDAAGMRAALQRQPWDVIICDHHLPQFDAPAALFILHEAGCDVPFIVVSGAIGEDLAVAMMKSGASDYMLKSNLARLAPAVQREVREARVRRDTKNSEKKLREKETMLREIHHRVKNNMQVMSSMLSLQSRLIPGENVRRLLEDNRNRILSMALLHEILYQSADFAAVDFPNYARQLVAQLFHSYGVAEGRIRLLAQLDKIALSLDDALPLGLLINEVVSNALKHAFPGGRSGELRIQLTRQQGGATLVISDDGIGMPLAFDWTTSKSLGLRLVRTLSEQLGADLEIRSQGGVEVRLGIPIKGADENPKRSSENSRGELPGAMAWAGAGPAGFSQSRR